MEQSFLYGTFATILTVGFVGGLSASSAQASPILDNLSEYDDDIPEEDWGSVECNCYYDSECPEFQGCDIGTPLCMVSKADGLCVEWQSPRDIGFPDSSSGQDLLLEVIDSYFLAYESSISKGPSGPPDAMIMENVDGILFKLRATDSSQSVSKKDRKRISHELSQLIDVWPTQLGTIAVVKEREPIVKMLNNAMDRLLGFDFFIGAASRYGSIREVHNPAETVELLEAARLGIRNSILTGDPYLVANYIENFWTNHPGYEAMHTGRCFPHGHDDDVSPMDCQADALVRMTTVLVNQ